jgi:DNA-3-methyladenine glycosylase
VGRLERRRLGVGFHSAKLVVMPDLRSILAALQAHTAFEPLARAFYEPPADVVAARLLGHLLLRRTPEGLCGGLIVETEAYLQDDPACHAFNGITPRNRTMFGPPGHAYVYFIYGNHHCVNAVCQPPGRGEAVLIRALMVVLGEPIMCKHRVARSRHELTNGPGKLCAALAIDLSLDGTDLCDPASPLFIAANPFHEACVQWLGPVATSQRIGITRAADWPLRFYLANSAFVSRRTVTGRAARPLAKRSAPKPPAPSAEAGGTG